MVNLAMPEKFLVGGDGGVRSLLWRGDGGEGRHIKFQRATVPLSLFPVRHVRLSLDL